MECDNIRALLARRHEDHEKRIQEIASWRQTILACALVFTGGLYVVYGLKPEEVARDVAHEVAREAAHDAAELEAARAVLKVPERIREQTQDTLVAEVNKAIDGQLNETTMKAIQEKRREAQSIVDALVELQDKVNAEPLVAIHTSVTALQEEAKAREGAILGWAVVGVKGDTTEARLSQSIRSVERKEVKQTRQVPTPADPSSPITRKLSEYHYYVSTNISRPKAEDLAIIVTPKGGDVFCFGSAIDVKTDEAGRLQFKVQIRRLDGEAVAAAFTMLIVGHARPMAFPPLDQGAAASKAGAQGAQ